MTSRQRTLYFTCLWPAACAAQGWDPRDATRRRACTLHATGHTSSSSLPEHLITALFCFLSHLADPENLTLAAQWVACQTNPRAYNQTLQGQWWEKKAYGRTAKKLHQNRFANSVPANPLQTAATEKTARDYLMTARSRARSKTKVSPANCPF